MTKAKFEVGEAVKINRKYSIAGGLEFQGINYDSILTIKAILFVKIDENDSKNNLIEYWFNECSFAVWEYELESYDIRNEVIKNLSEIEHLAYELTGFQGLGSLDDVDKMKVILNKIHLASDRIKKLTISV